mgnify:CR=1 FL=1
MRFSCTLQAGLVRGTKHPACGCTAQTSSSIPTGVLNREHCFAAGNPGARGGEGGVPVGSPNMRSVVLSQRYKKVPNRGTKRPTWL